MSQDEKIPKLHAPCAQQALLTDEARCAHPLPVQVEAEVAQDEKIREALRLEEE